MFNIALYQPEIPPNTGNIIRLCANTGSTLHLIHPLGFTLEDRQLRRAGLDYSEWANVKQHADYAEFRHMNSTARIFGCSTRGSRDYHEVNYTPGDFLLFGPETRGLPQQTLDFLGEDLTIRIPMMSNSRSLNLSNSVAVILYEALRQNGFSHMS